MPCWPVIPCGPVTFPTSDHDDPNHTHKWPVNVTIYPSPIMLDDVLTKLVDVTTLPTIFTLVPLVPWIP